VFSLLTYLQFSKHLSLLSTKTSPESNQSFQSCAAIVTRCCIVLLNAYSVFGCVTTVEERLGRILNSSKEVKNCVKQVDRFVEY